MAEYNFTSDVVIGLEVHVELNTSSKLFCSCPTSGSEVPNSRVCPICLGHPGSKPVLNKKAVEYAIKLCLALGCELSSELIFSRKSYFYPDMSKNYQITQFEKPLGRHGFLKLKSNKEVKLTRIHIEEDPASLSYPSAMDLSPFVFIDYNRSGNPLCEIVTEPIFTSPAETREFLKKLVSVLTYLKIFDVNKNIIKADANISVKESNYSRVEIKNISGFKEIEQALAFEIMRQKAAIKDGGKIVLETRGWDIVTKSTKSLRTKETEADYGYIIDPDLGICDINEKLVSQLREEIPELAHQKAERFVKQYKIDKTDAEVISMELELAELFERVASRVNPKLAAIWLRRELLRVLNYSKKSIQEVKFDEKNLIELMSLIESKTISSRTAQKLMDRLIEQPFSPAEYVKKQKLTKLSSTDELTKICKEVISANFKVVQDYKSGKQEALNYLFGQVIKATRGTADISVVRKIIVRLI